MGIATIQRASRKRKAGWPHGQAHEPEPWQISQFFEIPRRLGAFGHVTDEEGHNFYRSQRDDSENLSEDSRNLLLFERAREWLLEQDADDEKMG